MQKPPDPVFVGGNQSSRAIITKKVPKDSVKYSNHPHRLLNPIIEVMLLTAMIPLLSIQSSGKGRGSMKNVIRILVLVMLFVPFQFASAESKKQNVITLTADQVDSADDIEAAIISATAQGTRPGTVILDGRNGAFVFSGEDRSLNLFVSNLNLRGVYEAVIENCDDGLFFDDFPLKNILVEGISFVCTGDGVEAAGAFKNVTLANNMFRAGNNGIGTNGASSDWLIRDNVIWADLDGIQMSGAEKVEITKNQIHGYVGVSLLQTSQITVRRNEIGAVYQGVFLGQESWRDWVLANHISGVSAAGVALEVGVARNLIVANRVECADGIDCLRIDAAPETAKINIIAGNR